MQELSKTGDDSIFADGRTVPMPRFRARRLTGGATSVPRSEGTTKHRPGGCNISQLYSMHARTWPRRPGNLRVVNKFIVCNARQVCVTI